METYKCIKAFTLPFFDEDGRMTNGIHEVEKDSVWESSPDYTSNSEIRLYLKEGNSDFEYIDITYKRMEQHFIRVAWLNWKLVK